MKTMTLAALLIAGVVLFFGSMMLTSADASVINITGGGPTGGWLAPTPASVVVAYDVGGNGGQTIQGISFQGWNTPQTSSTVSHITESGITDHFEYGNGGLSFGAGANNTGMASMLDWAGYSFDNTKVGPITLTITGLNAMQPYRIDVFEFVTTNRQEIFTFTDNAGTQQTDNYPELANSPHFYLVNNIRTATSGGQITLAITSTAGGAPALSGIVISAAPEPASIGMLAVGGVMLLRRRRA